MAYAGQLAPWAQAGAACQQGRSRKETAPTIVGEPYFGIVSADAAGDGLADAAVPEPHLHPRQLLAQLPSAPSFHAQKLYQLPAHTQGPLPCSDAPCSLLTHPC